MNYYLVRTGYGTDILWCGSSGEAACKNAADATGLPIVGFRPISTDIVRTAA